jgi:hypothetical protein
MAHYTGNTGAFINDHVYSSMILEHLEDNLLPMSWSRNVSEFSHGSILNIKTLGSVTLQEVAENQSITYTPIDTGNITMQITDYIGDGWYITDELRREGTQIEALMAARSRQSSAALARFYETRWLEAAERAQCAGDANSVNKVPHRYICCGCDAKAILDTFATMQYAFNQADVPSAGRIAIVDPSIELALNGLFTQPESLANNFTLGGRIPNGFVQEHKLVGSLFGWDVWTSTRLPRIQEETINYEPFGGRVKSIKNGIANLFMCLASDETKPLMHAWRTKAGVESNRNWHLRRDEYQTYARFGLGAQRVDTLGVVITDGCANLACIG